MRGADAAGAGAAAAAAGGVLVVWCAASAGSRSHPPPTHPTLPPTSSPQPSPPDPPPPVPPASCLSRLPAGGLDFSSPVKKFFYDPLGSGKAYVNTVVSLTGFALVGGPARQDAPKAVEALKALNVPYLVSLPLVFQTTEEWLDSELGVHPVQVALQVRGWVGAG